MCLRAQPLCMGVTQPTQCHLPCIVMSVAIQWQWITSKLISAFALFINSFFVYYILSYVTALNPFFFTWLSLNFFHPPVTMQVFILLFKVKLIGIRSRGPKRSQSGSIVHITFQLLLFACSCLVWSIADFTLCAD